jgi:PBP1b-binding outer membrane lipoprotein LpoB
LIQIPEIVQNPNKITVVMTGIDNKTSQPYADLTIFLARLRGKLATESHDKIAFYEKKATTANLQQTEGAGGNSDPFEEGSRTGIAPPPSRVVPNYALKGEFYDQPNVQTTYHLCQFELTNIQTGQIVWTGTYEVRTLN